MSKPTAPVASGPATHYELFTGLRDSGVAYLVTGAVALTLHGVPRLTPDVDLVVDPNPANLGRLVRLLAAWGYAETAPATTTVRGAAVRRFRHARSALGEIDIVTPAPEEFLAQQESSTLVTLVDVGIPLVGAAGLRTLKEKSGAAADRDDAAGLDTLASIRAGEQGGDDETLREQIRKFSRWSVAARLDWLLSAARLSRGLSPEAKPMTRGLVRRNPWTQRRR